MRPRRPRFAADAIRFRPTAPYCFRLFETAPHRGRRRAYARRPPLRIARPSGAMRRELSASSRIERPSSEIFKRLPRDPQGATRPPQVPNYGQIPIYGRTDITRYAHIPHQGVCSRLLLVALHPDHEQRTYRTPHRRSKCLKIGRLSWPEITTEALPIQQKLH